MLQLYSSGIDISANTAVPFDNNILQTSPVAVQIAPANLSLRAPGIYEVSVDGFATAGAAGLVTMQLYADGVPLEQAVSSFTGAAATVGNFHFKTFVEVSGCCCQASSVTLRLMNAGIAVTDAHVNISVLKVR